MMTRTFRSSLAPPRWAHLHELLVARSSSCHHVQLVMHLGLHAEGVIWQDSSMYELSTRAWHRWGSQVALPSSPGPLRRHGPGHAGLAWRQPFPVPA